MSLLGRLFWILVLFFGILLAVLFYRYKSVDPCRMLAIERTKDADAALNKNLGVEAGEPLERLNRAVTSQMSTGECFSELLDEWGEMFFGAKGE